MVASHNLRSLAEALALAEEAGLAATDVELQLLYGMAPGSRPPLVELGYRTRHYVPMGELEAGMAYLVRRLLENTSNESFVRPPGARPGRHPGAARSRPGRGRARAPSRPCPTAGAFHNEPVAELRRPEARRRLSAAVVRARAGLGFDAPV